jgi:uncharacterized membrane protein HdeD (DUF308 family)
MPLLTINIKKKEERPLGAPAAEPYDNYITKLLKLIPADVIAVYLTGLALIPTSLPDNQKIVPMVWLGICFIFVIIVRYLVTKDKDTPPNWMIIAISAVSFLIWSYSMGGPWATYNLYIAYIGGLLVLGWTFLIPFCFKDEVSTGVS